MTLRNLNDDNSRDIPLVRERRCATERTAALRGLSRAKV